MERLINQLILLIANLGGGDYEMKEMIHQVTKDNEKVWTREDIDKAIKYVTWYNEYFGKADAIEQINAMVKKFDISTNEINFAGKQKLRKTSRSEYAPEELWPTE